ncbi:hypothetical protein LIER_16223 [Lithospermum erythrorhizon]|uniref:Uncharacterized protein n=1 Tax=Lithospermum erythrorhizon TaxID=34254 RepID=A0AAV3QAG3_LITER
MMLLWDLKIPWVVPPPPPQGSRGNLSLPHSSQVTTTAPIMAGELSASVVLEPEDHGDVDSSLPGSNPFLCPTLLLQALRYDILLPFYNLLFPLLGVPRRLMSSYEEANGSSSRVGQLQQEVKTLKKEKAWEEGVLQQRLKNLTMEHDTLHERYAASIRRTEVRVTAKPRLWRPAWRAFKRLKVLEIWSAILLLDESCSFVRYDVSPPDPSDLWTCPHVLNN